MIAAHDYRGDDFADLGTGSLRGFAIRALVAAALVGVLGAVAFGVGVPWARSTGVAAASVGTWYLGLASHELRDLVCAVMRREGSRAEGLGGDVVAAAGAAGGFAVCLGAAALAAVVHTGSPVVFGAASVLVASAILTGTQRAKAMEPATRRRRPAPAPVAARAVRLSGPQVPDPASVIGR